MVEKRGHQLIVFCSGKFVIAINPTVWVNTTEFIPYAKELPNNVDAYEKFLHFLGKMQLKDIDSKYFGCPRLEEHLVNGGIEEEHRGTVLKLSKEALKVLSEFNRIDGLS